MTAQQTKEAAFLFESSWKKPYSTRGVRALLARYAHQADLEHNMPPHRLPLPLHLAQDPRHR